METQQKYKEVLSQIGLQDEESLIYELLLVHGPSKASRLVPKSGIKRGLVYKTLDTLIEKKLVEKIDEGPVLTYRAAHPQFLENVIAKERERFDRVSTLLQTEISGMTSLFNLALGKPNIQFFEGERGFKQVLDNCLHAKETILQWSDANIISEKYKKANDEHIVQRVKKKIQKKILAVASSEQKMKIAARAKDDTLTEFRFFSDIVKGLPAVIMVYDTTVSYMTLSKETMIAVNIQDARIADSMKALFVAQWDKAVKL